MGSLRLTCESWPDPDIDPKGAAIEAAKKGFSPFKVFLVLRDFLQPDSTMSFKSATKAISDMLPENAPASDQTLGIASVCFELAEQIPYHHPSQQKLARLVEKLSQLSKLTEKVVWKGRSTYVRFPRLGEHLRDQLTFPDEDTVQQYASYTAFIANLHERRIMPTDPVIAVWQLRHALEEDPEESDICRDGHILGAAQWVLWNGQTLFLQARSLGSISSKEKSSLSTGKLYDGKSRLDIDRWRFWKSRLQYFAGLEGVGDECKAVAGRAADMMDAFERCMSF